MRFFDYKFLILLGLTLVVYFIYREVEYLRDKINKLEQAINLNPKSIEQSDDNKKFPVLSFPKMSEQIIKPNNLQTTSISGENKPQLETKLNTPKVSPKMISVDLISTTMAEIGNDLNSNGTVKTPSSVHNKILVQQKINDILEHSDSETATNVSESSKHLAIYSNDNEQFDETQNSLIESVEANKNDLKFDYNRMEIPDLKGTMESIMNNLSSDTNSENKIDPNKKPSGTLDTQSAIDEIIEEKEKQLSEMSNSSEKSTDSKTRSESDETKSESDETKSESESTKTESESTKTESDKLDERTLNNMKLPDIKKLAEQNKIIITKKVNGQQKPKNKNELITEILNKLSS